MKSEYDKLKDNFDLEVKALQERCPHTDVTDWIEEWWAIGHPTLRKVKVCKNCNLTIAVDESALIELRKQISKDDVKFKKLLKKNGVV